MQTGAKLATLETILPAASALAKRHVAYGASPYYAVVGSVLLWTLEKGLGESWTPEIASAWTAADGTPFMTVLPIATNPPTTMKSCANSSFMSSPLDPFWQLRTIDQAR
jgi:hypothetical protein